MKGSTIVRLAAVGATCGLVGAAAGIAGSSASTPRKTNGLIWFRQFTEGKVKPGIVGAMIGAPGFAFALPTGAVGPVVHSESVVPNEKGGFETVTMDRGMFSSLSGEQLTIVEGTKTATYKTVTLTIPSGAKVYLNGVTAHLSDIKSGDTVTVLRGHAGIVVNAYNEEYEPKQLHKIAPGEVLPLPGPLRAFGPLGKMLTPAERATTEESLQKFAKCMREHGVKVETRVGAGSIAVIVRGGRSESGPNPEGPAFQGVPKGCQSLMPRLPGAPRGEGLPPRHPLPEESSSGSESGTKGSSTGSESASSGGD